MDEPIGRAGRCSALRRSGARPGAAKPACPVSSHHVVCSVDANWFRMEDLRGGLNKGNDNCIACLDFIHVDSKMIEELFLSARALS